MASCSEVAGTSNFKSLRKQCCDPFKCHKQRKTQGLREISAGAITAHSPLGLQIGDKACTQCRKRIYSLASYEIDREPHSQQNTDESTCASGDESEEFIPSGQHQLLVLNSSLSAIGESPVVKKSFLRRPVMWIRNLLKCKRRLKKDSK